MTQLVVDIVSWGLILAGCFFTVVGSIGLVRMPDVYTRMHAASVTDTLGAGIGAMATHATTGGSQLPQGSREASLRPLG